MANREEYGWGFEGRRDGWHRQVPEDQGNPEHVGTDAWEEQGPGFVDHAWEPGGKYDDEAGRQPPQGSDGVGGYGQGGGGDEAGYGGFAGGGGATTGVLGYGEGEGKDSEPE